MEIVSRLADRSIHRSRYADLVRRSRQLAVALADLGVRPGDRVATLGWNHHQHLEAYFAVPSLGAVLHTLNVRQHPDELARVARHAGDRVVIVDASMLPVFDQCRQRIGTEQVVVMGGVDGTAGTDAADIDFEDLVACGDASRYVELDLDERSAAAMCYTSGTTGEPKGVTYSHRVIALHAMHWTAADVAGASQRDTMLAVVPMFHINGWGMAFAACLAGARLVLPNRYLDAESLLELIAAERVTVSGGVPAVWLAVLRELERGAAFDVSSLRALLVGGSAAPPALIRGFERLGVPVLHAWGMTETTALATVVSLPPDLADGDTAARDRARLTQGRPLPFVEIRARSEDGLVPWDGETMGELEVRGPTVATSYVAREGDPAFTPDGWFRTGDIVTIDQRGFVEIQDRARDLIRSGGEWISSVLLENELMNHPAVAEAAVVAMPDDTWGERPRAYVVLKAGSAATADDLRAHLRPHIVKWWMPDAFEFIDELPRSSTGKIHKLALRTRQRGPSPPSPPSPPSSSSER